MKKCSSAGLGGENRVFVHPVCRDSETHVSLIDDWELVGWCSAPWKRATGLGTAIVYRKLSPSVEFGRGDYDHFEPGIYWAHGDPDKFQGMI